MFKPNISQNSRDLAKRFKSDAPTFEELYKHASLFAERKKIARE